MRRNATIISAPGQSGADGRVGQRQVRRPEACPDHRHGQAEGDEENDAPEQVAPDCHLRGEPDENRRQREVDDVLNHDLGAHRESPADDFRARECRAIR